MMGTDATFLGNLWNILEFGLLASGCSGENPSNLHSSARGPIEVKPCIANHGAGELATAQQPCSQV